MNSGIGAPPNFWARGQVSLAGSAAGAPASRTIWPTVPWRDGWYWIAFPRQSRARVFIDNPLTASEMAVAVVHYFVASDSYNEMRRRVSMVERIKVWTLELLQRIETAARDNVGIRECYGMPARISAFVQRHSGRG